MGYIHVLRQNPRIRMGGDPAQVRVARSAEMAAIDRRSIEELGIPGCVLMENAGRAMAYALIEAYPRARHALIVCGPGNNGGDGFVIGRTLLALGRSVTCVALKNVEALPPDARLHAQAFRQAGGDLRYYGGPSELENLLPKCDLAVDSLFGTGLRRALGGASAEIATLLNDAPIPVIGVDVPSGICSDTGQAFGIAVKCALTLTVGLPKTGLLCYPGSAYAGDIEVLEIGFSPALLHDDAIGGRLLTRAAARRLVPERSSQSHKGSCGTALVVAGSQSYPGAPVLASGAALRAGAGLVRLASTAAVCSAAAGRFPELLTTPLPESGGCLSAASWATLSALWQESVSHRPRAVCFGPGLTRTPGVGELLAAYLASAPAPTVLDADALWHLAHLSPQPTTQPLVLTPHCGEMATLLASTPADVSRNMISAALSCARLHNAVVVLKGNPTVIAYKEHYYLNTTGGPVLSQGGTGDVLAGTIAGLMAQGNTALEAALLGVYLHGSAGDDCALRLGPRGVLASEVAEALPRAMRQLLQDEDAAQ